MALDTYKKEQDRLKKEEADKAGVPEAIPEGPTVKEILADSHMNGLLGEMLKVDGGNQALGKRIVEGKLKEDDFEELADYRERLNANMRSAEKIREQLTPELATEIGQMIPGFKDVLANISPEDLVSTVSSQLDLMSVRDPEAFKKLSKGIEKLTNYRNKEQKEFEESLDELAKKHGLDGDAYLRVLAIDDKDEREKALKGLIKEGGWLNYLFTSSKSVKELLKKKKDIDAALGDLAKLKRGVGSVLAASIKDNDDIREAVSKEIAGMKSKEKSPVGMKEVKDDQPTKEKMIEDWDEYKKSKHKNWKNMSQADKDLARDAFLDEEEQEYDTKSKKRGSFWDKIIGAMFLGFFTNFDKKDLL